MLIGVGLLAFVFQFLSKFGKEKGSNNNSFIWIPQLKKMIYVLQKNNRI